MIVAVPWRDTGCRWRAQSRSYTRKWWEPLEVVEFDSPGRLFSRGASLNMAFTDTTADVVIAVDSDIVVRPEQIETAVDLARDGAMVLPFSEASYLGAPETAKVLTGTDPFTASPDFEFVPNEATPLVGGINVVSRETWETVGGWPELRGWGCEDLIFAHCCAVLADVRRVDGPMIHLFHTKTGDYADADHSDALQRVTSTVDPDELREVLDELRVA